MKSSVFFLSLKKCALFVFPCIDYKKMCKGFLMPKTIIIDPGHGGFDPGAVFGNRREKDDNLRLALAVGQGLENAGYHIIYTRKDDRYDSPYDKAQIANNAGGDLFLSFHRNFAERPDLYNGVQALIYDKNPLALRVAEDINQELEKVGFENLGIESRKELVVLRRTEMPAVLLEVGFINSSVDNKLFDEKFDEIVNAIVNGVEQAFPPVRAKETTADEIMTAETTQAAQTEISNAENPDNTARTMEDMRISLNGIQCEVIPNQPERPEPKLWYYVQVGLFRYPENAVYLMEQLKQQGYPSIWRRVGGLIAIWIGPLDTLDEAVSMQQRLQADGYETLIVTDDYVAR